MGAIDGTKSLKESLSGILKSVGRMFLNQAIGGIMPKFGAEGGYASGATNAVIGEAGPEYVIPEQNSMARCARGARGSAVIPENGEGGNGEGGGVSASTLDVRYSVERINSVDYVTASEFQAGMRQAAAQGAQRGSKLHSNVCSNHHLRVGGSGFDDDLSWQLFEADSTSADGGLSLSKFSHPAKRHF